MIKLNYTTKQILKVLIKKTKGMSRVEKVDRMDLLLTSLNLQACRWRRDGRSFCELGSFDNVFSSVDLLGEMLKKVKDSRLNPRRVFKQLELQF